MKSILSTSSDICFTFLFLKNIINNENATNNKTIKANFTNKLNREATKIKYANGNVLANAYGITNQPINADRFINNLTWSSVKVNITNPPHHMSQMINLIDF